MHVLKPSFAASFTFKVDGVPGASRRFIGKVKNRVALKEKEQSPEISARKKEVDDGESIGGGRGGGRQRERVCLRASAQRRIKGLCSASQWTSGHQY